MYKLPEYNVNDVNISKFMTWCLPQETWYSFRIFQSNCSAFIGTNTKLFLRGNHHIKYHIPLNRNVGPFNVYVALCIAIGCRKFQPITGLAHGPSHMFSLAESTVNVTGVSGLRGPKQLYIYIILTPK